MRLLAVLAGLGLWFAGGVVQAAEKIDLPRSKTADLTSPTRILHNGQHRFVINVLEGAVRFKGRSFKDLDGPMQRTEAVASMADFMEELGRRTAERGPEGVTNGTPKMPLLFHADRAQPWSIVGNVMRTVRTADFPFRRFQLAYTDGAQDRLIEFVESDEQRLEEVARVPAAPASSVEDVATKVPEGVTNPPLVVSILHESQWSSLPTYRLSAKGLAAASFMVHGSKDAPFPVSIHQAKAAIRWLRAHAKLKPKPPIPAKNK